MSALRWMDKETPGRYIMVNIPSQTLWAVDGGKVAYEMPVIVGKPDRQTNAFRAEIKGIRFNPNWTVPMGIKMKDFLPKLQEDPTYLSQKGIEVYEGTGSERRTVDPTEVDWSAMTRRDMNQLSMVQKQGDNNAPGRIRVLMPNGAAVDTIEYLIDGQQRRVGRKLNGAVTHRWLYQNQLNPVAELIKIVF